MVQLPGVNTTQFNWCRSRLAKHPMPVPPIYQPEIPAEAVYCAAHYRRRLWVGYSAAQAIFGNRIAPSFADWYLARTGSTVSRSPTCRSAPTAPTTSTSRCPAWRPPTVRSWPAWAAGIAAAAAAGAAKLGR